MLIDTQRMVTYKCSFCGKIQFIPVSLFSLLKRKEAIYFCNCKQSFVKYTRNPRGNFRVEASCLGCGQTHTHYLNIKAELASKATIINCPVTGIEQIFIGTDRSVKAAVDNFERRMNDIADSLGYDNYFKNPMVMLQTINKIHEMAENGKLYCKCGSNNIELILLPNRVQLKCNSCNAKKLIPALDSNDLRNVLDKPAICLNQTKSFS